MKELNSKRTLSYLYEDKESKKTQLISVELSEHADNRIAERNINPTHLMMAMEYGEQFFKQGLVFYAVPDKNIPKELDGKLRFQLNNLVVVLDPNSAEVITCYKSNNAVKYIKKKQKRLSKRAA